MGYEQIVTNKGEYDYKRDVLATVSLNGDEYYTMPQHANDIVDSLNFKGGGSMVSV